MVGFLGCVGKADISVGCIWLGVGMCDCMFKKKIG